MVAAMTDIERPPHETVVFLSVAGMLSRALHVLADLGVADALDDEPRPASELATAVGADPDALHRLMRAVATQGVFAARDGGWVHTAASRMLRADHPVSLRAFARMLGMPASWDCLAHLHDSARTGRAATLALHPRGFFGLLADDPDQSALFDAAMTGKAAADVLGVLDAVDLSDVATVADVGGGAGHLVEAVLEAYPRMTGTLFDQPHVVAGVSPRPDGRLTLHAGDFFTDPLPRADVTLLMNILHDWDDADAGRILAALATAAEPGDRLLVIEGVLSEDDAGGATPGTRTVAVADLIMLTVTGGRERTAAEYRDLLAAAGYELTAVTPTFTGICVLDAVRR